MLKTTIACVAIASSLAAVACGSDKPANDPSREAGATNPTPANENMSGTGDAASTDSSAPGNAAAPSEGSAAEPTK